MKKLSVVIGTLVWIIRGFFLINHGNTHRIFIDWRRDDWPFIYFVIFVSMDEKIECRSLYFLVSILRGIIFIEIVVITHTHIILASRWLTIHLLCYFRTFVWILTLTLRGIKWFKKLKFRNFMINIKKIII